MSDELVNATLVPMDDVSGTSLEQYAGRGEVRELAVRLMRLHPAAKDVGDAGMLAVAQLALMVGANPLPGLNEIHIWWNKKTQSPQVQLGINYDRRKAREHGGIAWQEQPRPMTDAECESYGVPDHEIGAICSGCRRDDMLEMAHLTFTSEAIFKMVGAVGYATCNRQERAKKGRTLSWTAEKRAEADILRKLFPNLESTSGNEPWREQIAMLTDEPAELTQEEAKAQLAHGVKLLRGDHDEDDPFALDAPERIIRTTDEPEPVEVDVIDVDVETGELLDGMRADQDLEAAAKLQAAHPMRGQVEVDVPDEGPVPQEERKAAQELAEDELPFNDEENEPDHGPTPLQLEMAERMLKKLNNQTRHGFFGDLDQLLDCLRVETGEPELAWPLAGNTKAWADLYTVGLRYANKNM